MNGKRIVVYGIVGCLTLGNISYAFADKSKDNYTKKCNEFIPYEFVVGKSDNLKINIEKITYNKDNIKIDMEIPVISGLEDSKYEEQLNYLIKLHAMKAKEEFEKDANELNAEKKKQGHDIRESQFKYGFHVKNTENILSIVIEKYTYLGGANGITENEYYNIDRLANRNLEIKDIFKENSNYKEIINNEIKRQIAKDKDKYFSGDDGFKTITDTQQFYVNDGNLVIAFPKYEIAPGSSGIPQFKISLSSLSDILKNPIPVISKDIYRNNKYNFTFKIAPIWKDKVYVVEKYDIDQYKAKVDFIYKPEYKRTKESNLLSIMVMDNKDYKDLSRRNKESIGFVIAETEDYVYLAKTYGANPYVKNTKEYNEYRELSSVIDGIDDLFQLVPVQEETKEITNYRWIMVNGKKINLNKDMYKSEKGNLMIPVSKVSKALGYKVKWNPQNNSITLDEGKVSIISIGKNSYGYMKSSLKLEEKAINNCGTAFVPVNYFEDVLKLKVTVGSNGILNISK